MVFDLKVNKMKPHLPYVVVQISEPIVSMKKIEKHFVVPFLMGNHLEIMPISFIQYPLAVWENNGGRENECFAVLPKRKWPAYFSRNIQSHLKEKN